MKIDADSNGSVGKNLSHMLLKELILFCRMERIHELHVIRKSNSVFHEARSNQFEFNIP